MYLNSWAAVIPAYNAARTIHAVIEGVSAHLPLDRILVVDDGSTDETPDVARSTGAHSLLRESNGGKGRALRDGFDEVLQWNPDWVICLDADGQHDPAAIPLFQHATERGEFDLIVGNRRGDLGHMPLLRRFSNLSSSRLLSLRTGIKLPDVQCGYRAVKADALHCMDLQTDSYDIEAEMIIKAWHLNCRIGWVSIPAIYRGESSFIRKYPETIRFLKLLARSLYE